MNPKKRIMEFLREKTHELSVGRHTEDTDKLRAIVEGMGTGTAVLVIEHQLNERIGRHQTVEGLKNEGRYYTAKIVEQDGSVIQRLIVDKQSGIVRFVKG